MQSEYGDHRLIDTFCQFKFTINNVVHESGTDLDFFYKYYNIVKEFINDNSTDFTKVQFAISEKIMRYPIPGIPLNTYCIHCGKISDDQIVLHKEDCNYLKDNYSAFYTKKGIEELKSDGIIDDDTLKKFTSRRGVKLPYMYNNMSRKIINYDVGYTRIFSNQLFIQRKTIPIKNSEYCYTNKHRNGVTTTFHIFPTLDKTNNYVMNVPFYYEDCKRVYALEYIDNTLKEIFGGNIIVNQYLSNLSSTIRFGVRFNIQAIEEDKIFVNVSVEGGALTTTIKLNLDNMGINNVECKFIIRPSGILQCLYTFKEPYYVENETYIKKLLNGNLQQIVKELVCDKILIDKYTLTKEQDKKRTYEKSDDDNLIQRLNGKKVSQTLSCKHYKPKPFSFTLGMPFMNDYAIQQEGKVNVSNLKKGLRLYEPCCGKLELNPAHKKLFQWKYTEEDNCELNINFIDNDTPDSKLKKLFESSEKVNEDKEKELGIVNQDKLLDCINRLTKLLCKDPKGTTTFVDGRTKDMEYCKLFRRTMYGFPNEIHANDTADNNGVQYNNKHDAITCIPGTDTQESRQLTGLLEINDRKKLLNIVRCYWDYLQKLSSDPIDSAYFYFRVKKGKGKEKLKTGPGKKTYFIFLYELSDSEDNLNKFDYNECETNRKYDEKNALIVSKYEYNQIKDGKIYKFTAKYAWKVQENKKIFPKNIGASQQELPKLNIISNQTFDLEDALKRPDELDIVTVNEIQKKEWDRIWGLLYSKKR